MKVGISRFVAVAVITGLLLVAGSTTAWAQSPNYSPDFSTNQNLMNLNGNTNGLPAFSKDTPSSPTVLRLTPSAGNRVAAAWFNVQQPVQNGFTTTFTFQLTNPSDTPADGIAFVIQNDTRKTGAIGFIGGNGGALGYGDSDNNVDPSQGEGIANSLAIEFDTYQNGWDLQNANHIAIQSCGTGPNTSHHNVACGGNGPTTSTLGFFPIDTPTFSAGVSHTVKITYTPPCSTCTLGTLQVALDAVTPVSVDVNLSTLLALSSGNAYVGFTAATGGSFETQDIGSWTFQAQAPPEETTVFNFPSNNYLVTPDEGQQTANIQVTPVLKTPADCDALVQANTEKFVDGPMAAKCFVYQGAGGPGVDRAVMYEVICSSSATGCNPFNAELGSTYDLSTMTGNNTGFNPSNPFPGWLKGEGGDPAHPCTPPASGFLFKSNQVSFFDQDVNDPVTKGRSGGTASCWTATYNTPHEAPTVTITTPGDGANYPLNATVNAAYTCEAVNKGSDSKTGPYLDVTSCAGTVPSGTPIDTSTTGTKSFSATVEDSATDTATSTVTYNVVAPADLAILKLAPLLVRAGGTITYTHRRRESRRLKCSRGCGQRYVAR